MIANYYTLQHVTLELDRHLSGLPIEEVFTQSKNELLIACTRNEESTTLLISCEPAANYMVLRSDIHRAKKNSLDVFKPIWGTLIERITIQPMDREIIVYCRSPLRIVIQLFGSKANVLLVDKDDRVADAFLRPNELVGTIYRQRSLSSILQTPSYQEFVARLTTIGTVLLSAALKKQFPLFGSLLVRELCRRSGLREDQLVAELHEESTHRLYDGYIALLEELERLPIPRIYVQRSMPPVFSLVELTHLQEAEEERFDALSTALRVFVGKSRKQKSALQEKEHLLQFLNQGIERAERTLKKMAEETQSLARAAEYETYGKLLMANLHWIEKGMKEVAVENVFSPARETVTIRLDHVLTPARNAERYFDKAKTARTNVGGKLERKEEIEQRWVRLRSLRENLLFVQTPEQLVEYLQVHKEELSALGYTSSDEKGKGKKEEVPFRVFVVAGGFQVWAGKSNENNDLLTMKYAKPNDLWFHTRGSSGSHVVLRKGTGKGEPSKQAMEQAASIAAYYSKMKNARSVPVAMTQRKYVRKPKGAPTGTVTIEREKLLFVDPKLPQEKK